MTNQSDNPLIKPARLAIAMPAFGRAEAIANSLFAMASEAHEEGLDIAFYVSDDSPDASVKEAIQPLIDDGLPVCYRHNEPALRHDRNLIATLLWPDADYVWLMGSNFRAASGRLASIYNFLQDQDFLFLNIHADDQRTVPMLRHEEARAFLRDLLWHQSLTGATIYGRAVRSWARARGDDLIVMPDFPQISVMMGYASDDEPRIGWFGGKTLQGAVGATASYWQTKAVDVFVDNWAAAITAFPKIVPAERRSAVIRSHSARTNLFNTSRLIELKKAGQFRWSSLRQRHFRDAMHVSFWKLLAILALPDAILESGSNFYAGPKRALIIEIGR